MLKIISNKSRTNLRVEVVYILGLIFSSFLVAPRALEYRKVHEFPITSFKSLFNVEKIESIVKPGHMCQQKSVHRKTVHGRNSDVNRNKADSVLL